MHDFCFLSSTSALASHYLALCFFRSISSCFRLTVTSSVLVFHFRFLRLPLYLSPNLLWLTSRFLYLAFCLFLFALPWFTPTAVSQVIPLCFRFRDFPLPVHFLSSVSFSLLATSLSVSSFLFLLALPHSGFSNVSVLPFGFTVFPILSCLISHAFLLGSDTWLSVCFLSSFPVSLPQLFHRCFPLSTFLRPFLCRDFLLAFSFLSSASARFWLLSILHFLFPSSWLPHAAVLISAYLPHLSSLFPCFPSDCGTQRSAIPFSDHCFVSQNYFNVSAFSLRKSADFPWLAL